MKRVWVSLIATAMAGIAAAQSAPTVLYSPARDIKDQGIGIKAWGSGVISQTDEVAYEGTHSIRVSTRNFFQGGMLSFGTAVPLASEFSDKENLLRLTFKMADGSASGSTGFKGAGNGPGGIGPGGGLTGGPGGIGSPSAPGGQRGGQRGGRGGVGGQTGPGGPGGIGGPGGVGGRGGQRGGPGGFGGQGPGTGGPGGIGPGGFGGAFGGGGASSAPAPLKTLRFIVTTSDGKKSEAYVPVNLKATDDKGWLTVSVPLQAISGFDRTNKEVTELGLAGDATTTFYVGDVRVINDSTPIRGEINQSDLNLGLGEEVTLSAYGYGGASILKYTWDFDSSDGIQVDAEGQSVTRRFRKAGTYTITLTVTDFYGLKKPYTTTIKAVVNP